MNGLNIWGVMVIILVIITVFSIIDGCLKTSIGRVVVVVTGVHTS